jgi:hypothetical protein
VLFHARSGFDAEQKTVKGPAALSPWLVTRAVILTVMHRTVPRIFDAAILGEIGLVDCWDKSPPQWLEKPREMASWVPFLRTCVGLTAELLNRLEQLIPQLVVLRHGKLLVTLWLTRLIVLRLLDRSVGGLRPSLLSLKQ